MRLQRLELPQERAVAALLVRAFADDPLVRVLCDADPTRRLLQTTWSFRMSVRAHCLSPQPAWVLNDGRGAPAGVILVSRPSMSLNGRPDILFSLRALPYIGWRTIQRGLRAGALLAQHAPRGPFTYIRTLGIDPRLQRQGLGSQLLRQALQSAPPQWPVYLETARERNLRFYERHGLQCVGKFEYLGITIWRMLRPVLRPREIRRPRRGLEGVGA